MKKIFLITLFFIVIENTSLQAAAWNWARSAGSVSNDYGNAACTDKNGNVFIAGTFMGSSITLGNFTLQNVSSGTLDVFVAKYDANGNVIWAQSGGGNNFDYCYAVCSDDSGSIYIAGYFRSPTITFGTITLNNTDSTGNSTDVFITKYDSSGNVVWAKSWGNNEWQNCYGICTDNNNNVYITGFTGYAENVIIGNDTLINRGNYDIFIVKYDTEGNTLWARGMGGTDWDGGMGICSDVNGNIFVTGYFQRTAYFGNDSLVTHSQVGFFIAKYDKSGNMIWVKTEGGPSLGSYAIGQGIVADDAGNTYVTGYFYWSANFGDTLSNYGSNSIFVTKYDANGNVLWGRCPGGTGYDYGTGICLNANGNVFITGYFESSFLNFNGIPVINANVGYDDIFVAEYDTSGNATWAGSVGGPDYDYGMGICSRGNNVYVAGYFGSYSLNFNNTTLINNGSYDIFLAKLGTVTGIEENTAAAWRIFPNPSNGSFTVLSTQFSVNNTLDIYNMLGSKIYSTQFNGQQKIIDCKLNEGIYFIQLTAGHDKFSSKIIIE